VAKPLVHHVDVPYVTGNVSHSALMACGNTNISCLFNMTYGNKDVPFHANMCYYANTSLDTDTLPQSPQCKDAPFADVSGSGTFDVSASNDESDLDVPVIAHVSHNSKPHKEPMSLQLGFYKGHWFCILTLAKAQYRYYIHIDISFPEHNDKSLRSAHECLLESVDKYMEEIEHAKLNKG
jgi:hypothetical protein